MRVEYTHKGWFGVCPVYIADPDNSAPAVDPRHILLAPIFWLSEMLFAVVLTLGAALSDSYEPCWLLYAVAELPHPRVREYPDVPEQP